MYASLILSAFVIFTFSTSFAFAQTIDQEKELLGTGIEFIALEEYDNAISYFDKVLEINPNNTIAFNNKAYSYFQQDYIIHSIMEYANTLIIDPSNESATTNLVLLKSFIPYVESKGFVEITIYNSQNQLIGYLKSDKVKIIDGKDTVDYIKRVFHKKTITHNDEKFETYQFENASTYTENNFAGLSGLAHPEFTPIYVTYIATDQYYIVPGDTVTFHYTFFELNK